jgi:hypothetical protein
MGDRCNMTLTFHGAITLEQADELIDKLAFYDFVVQSLDDDPYDPNKKLLATELSETLDAEEINYADISLVTNYCLSEKIAFEVWNSAGSGYPEGIVRFDGNESKTFTYYEGEALIPLSKILDINALTTGLTELMEDALFMAKDLPPLELIVFRIPGS